MTNPVTLHLGDCRDVLATLPDGSIDAVVTDPPYGLGKAPDALAMLRDWLDTGHHDVKGRGFMGREWDAFVPQPVLWREVYRVMKPGAHLVAFAGTRTQDLMGLALRLAGFEIRDCLSWLYGTGFPKSLDISKAIDKAAGAAREVIGRKADPRYASPATASSGAPMGNISPRTNAPSSYFAAGNVTAPATPEAAVWQGWGTALKPAYEPIILARKPLAGTVVANVQAHGTGGINIDGCRIGTDGGTAKGSFPNGPSVNSWGSHLNGACDIISIGKGRWPANVVLNEQAAALLDAEAGETVTGAWDGFRNAPKTGGIYGEFAQVGDTNRARPADRGGPSRFFYTAKASSAERELEDGSRSTHPTMKPTDLMRWLVRLVTPPGGTVLDPFAGSGTTGVACAEEGFDFIGVERETEYHAIAFARIAAATRQGRLDL